MERTDIVETVVQQLQGVDLTAKEIAAKAGVEESWLRMFRRGKIPNPGVRQFSKVVDYLKRNGKRAKQ